MLSDVLVITCAQCGISHQQRVHYHPMGIQAWALYILGYTVQHTLPCTHTQGLLYRHNAGSHIDHPEILRVNLRFTDPPIYRSAELLVLLIMLCGDGETYVLPLAHALRPLLPTGPYPVYIGCMYY